MMIDKVSIQSLDGEGRLVLSGMVRDSQDQPGYADATIVLSGLVARTRICLQQGAALIGLFEDLAAAKQGWKGEKYAETSEGELRFKCTCNNLQHSVVEVTLRSIPFYWVVKGIILVENGECERITSDLKQFFNLVTADAY
jgi:hypothetical protein